MDARSRTTEAYEAFAHSVRSGVSKAVAFQVNVESAIRAAENEALERAAKEIDCVHGAGCGYSPEGCVHAKAARRIRSLKTPETP